MFTGLVIERGRLIEDPAPPKQGGEHGARVLTLGFGPTVGERLSIGASLAVSGVCLTLTELFSEHEGGVPSSGTVELSPETLARTTLGSLEKGDEVNLEPSLRVGDPLGGHWVQGHVDTTVELVERRDLGAHRELAFSLPSEHRASVVEKGSVTLDGVSLTVSALRGDADSPSSDGIRFEVALIPHTLEVTTLGQRVPGDRLNFEADVLAKYIEQALAVRGWATRGGTPPQGG